MRLYFSTANIQSRDSHLVNQRACMWRSISAYFCILCTYGEAYSTSSLGGAEHAFSSNFILCRELVMTVNIPVKKMNATCRIVASAGNLINYTKFYLKKYSFIKMAAKQRLLCYEAMTYMQALYRPRCIMFLITVSQDGSECCK